MGVRDLGRPEASAVDGAKSAASSRPCPDTAQNQSPSLDCAICGVGGHRYGTTDPYHEYDAMGCVNALLPLVDIVPKWLRARAESYFRDAEVLRADGDMAMCVAYKTIANELRQAADEVRRG